MASSLFHEAAGPLLGVAAADLRLAGIFVLCLVAAISVHEWAHAVTADRLGDPTPSREGRVTLNPLAHVDPIGTLVLPIIAALFAPGMLFGWGKPVPTQPRLYTRRVSMRGGMALVAFAGPLSNLLLAVLTLGVIAAMGAAGVAPPLAPSHPLRVFYSLNVVLFAFNLVPLHPLDGGKVLAWILGARRQHIDDFLQRWGGTILLGLILLPPGRYVLELLLAPVQQLSITLLRWVIL
jgi:Zn-dependent protease